MNKEVIHFNKAIDAVISYRNAADDTSKKEALRLFYDRLCLHLLTGEFMNWLPIKLDYENPNEMYDPKNASKFKKSLNDVEGQYDIDIEDHKIIFKPNKAFALIENLLWQIQADLERDVTFAEIDLGIPNDLKTGDSLFSINILLLKIDMFFMSYENISELLEQLDYINSRLIDFRKKNNSIKGLTEQVMIITLEKTNFLFRKTLLSKSLTTKKHINKIWTPEEEHKLLGRIPNSSRFYMNFLYEHYKICVSHFGNKCPELSPEIYNKIEDESSDNSLENLSQYYWAARYYRQRRSDPTKKITESDIDINIKSISKLKSLLDKDEKYLEIKDKTSYDYKALEALRNYLKRVEWEIELGYQRSFTEDEFKKQLNKYDELKVEKVDQFFSLHRIFAKYCKSVLLANQIAGFKQKLVVWESWNIALAEWKNKIKSAFHHNYHPFFSVINETTFDIQFSESPPFSPPSRFSSIDLLKIDNKPLQIFIASGYLSPFNKNKLMQELSANRLANVQYLDNIIVDAKADITKDAIKEALDPKNDVIQLAKETAKETAEITAKETAEITAKETAKETATYGVKEVETRSLQTVTIFVSVITFASASVVVPKHVDTIGDAMLFLGILGLGLMIFVFILLFHFKRLDYEKERKALIQKYKDSKSKTYPKLVVWLLFSTAMLRTKQVIFTIGSIAIFAALVLFGICMNKKDSNNKIDIETSPIINNNIQNTIQKDTAK